MAESEGESVRPGRTVDAERAEDANHPHLVQHIIRSVDLGSSS